MGRKFGLYVVWLSGGGPSFQPDVSEQTIWHHTPGGKPIFLLHRIHDNLTNAGGGVLSPVLKELEVTVPASVKVCSY